MLGHFDDPAVAAVAPRVVSVPGDTILAAYEEAFSPLDLGGAPSLVAPGRRVSYVPTAALIVRVAAVDAVGGFDPALRYGEDVDLIWRLASAGHTVRYDPSVVVQHRPRSSWGAWFRQRMSYGSAAAPLASRHGDAIAPSRAPVELYGTIAAAVVAPGALVAGAAAATVTAAQIRVRRALGEHHQPAAVNGAMAQAFGSTVAAIPRAWAPLALVAAAGRRPRRRLAAMVMTAAAVEVLQRRPAVDPFRATTARLVDHLAYGVGVWQGVVHERSLTAVRPARSEKGFGARMPRVYRHAMTSIVQSRLDALVARCRREVDEGRLPGYQLAVGFDNEIVYAEAYGDAADHNRFHTYSAVKPTVSLTVLELAAEGLLDVDATVASVLPSFGETARTPSPSRRSCSTQVASRPPRSVLRRPIVNSGSIGTQAGTPPGSQVLDSSITPPRRTGFLPT